MTESQVRDPRLRDSQPHDPVAAHDRQVRDLLGRALDGERALHDAVTGVYQRAGELRRSRRRRVLAVSVVLVAMVATAGYAATDALMPRLRSGITGTAPKAPSPTAAPTTAQAGTVGVTPSTVVAPSDGVLMAAIDRLKPYGITVRPAARGDGWRRYTVLDEGQVTGTLDVVVYTAPAPLCFPKAAGRTSCAKNRTSDDGLEFATYTDDENPEQQYTEILARRSDGRAVAAYAAGLPASGKADAGDTTGEDADGPGEAPLTINKLQWIGLDKDMPDAFGTDEWCDRPDPSCPVLGVPMPTDDID
jgi:hypothetical protein